MKTYKYLPTGQIIITTSKEQALRKLGLKTSNPANLKNVIKIKKGE